MLDIPYVFLKPAIRYDKAKCLYETDNYEIFLNEHDSLKHFLNNNKTMQEAPRQILNENFSIIKKLFHLRQNFDRYELAEFKKEISQKKNLSSLWVREKLEEIEKDNL